MGPKIWFWTFAYDVSGVVQVTFRYRLDADGVNPKGNPFNDPEIDTSILPDEIADEYLVRLDSVKGALIDYYLSALDTKGNLTRDPLRMLRTHTGPTTTRRQCRTHDQKRVQIHILKPGLLSRPAAAPRRGPAPEPCPCYRCCSSAWHC